MILQQMYMYKDISYLPARHRIQHNGLLENCPFVWWCLGAVQLCNGALRILFYFIVRYIPSTPLYFSCNTYQARMNRHVYHGRWYLGVGTGMFIITRNFKCSETFMIYHKLRRTMLMYVSNIIQWSRMVPVLATLYMYQIITAQIKVFSLRDNWKLIWIVPHHIHGTRSLDHSI